MYKVFGLSFLMSNMWGGEEGMEDEEGWQDEGEWR